MHTLKLWRTFKEGKENFMRNGWLSFATISILSLSLFIVSLSFLLGTTSQLVLQNMREKVSVSISFNPDVPEERIHNIQNELKSYTKEVASVEYISREDALKQFLAESGNDPVIAQAVQEVGENPLLASLIIKAVRSDQYEIIVESIKKSNFQNDISRINYEKNKKIFERINHISQITQKVGLVLGSLFIFIAVLITFNTIRITIYSHRQEFEIMRLVGASNIYVRMPFVFEGALYGLVSSIITIIFLSIVSYYIAPYTNGAMAIGNFMDLYKHYAVFIFLALVAFGVMLGVLSSAIAIRRYLKT